MALCMAGVFGVSALRRIPKNCNAPFLFQRRELAAGMGRSDAGPRRCGRKVSDAFGAQFRGPETGGILRAKRQYKHDFWENAQFLAWSSCVELSRRDDAAA